MTDKLHKLFQTYPLTSQRLTSEGEVSVPYHVYDGYALLIGGTADLDAGPALAAAPVQVGRDTPV